MSFEASSSLMRLEEPLAVIDGAVLVTMCRIPELVSSEVVSSAVGAILPARQWKIKV